ncbi:hypothetical protein HDV05_000792 [Chytridiales sp. JEL 0842]|nr:hypothetical protein HDV05_000792 [Chytridiales sp. JEL 0842]
MYLKCFFATRGSLVVKSIFSPASQCNIEGSGDCSTVGGYISGIQARYTQAKRHLWGSLDTGYSIRKSIMAFLAPHQELDVTPFNLRHSDNSKTKDSAPPSSYGGITMDTNALIHLFHRLLEAHILMGHLFLLIITSSVLLPIQRSSIYMPLSTSLWDAVSDEPVEPFVESALVLSFWVRLACLLPNLGMIYFYERFHHWVGFQRWALSSPSPLTFADGVTVQHLGKRPQLAAERKSANVLDWLAIPVAGFLFYVIPQFHAQMTHLFSDRLEYKVASKPQLPPPKVPLQQQQQQLQQQGGLEGVVVAPLVPTYPRWSPPPYEAVPVYGHPAAAAAAAAAGGLLEAVGRVLKEKEVGGVVGVQGRRGSVLSGGVGDKIWGAAVVGAHNNNNSGGVVV